MKKVFMLLFFFVILSGCGNNDDELLLGGNLKDNNLIKQNVINDFKEGKKQNIKYQIEKNIIKVDDKKNREFIRKYYKLLKEKNIRKAWELSTWKTGKKSYETFFGRYKDLYDIKIIDAKLISGNIYSIITDMYYTNLYERVTSEKEITYSGEKTYFKTMGTTMVSLPLAFKKGSINAPEGQLFFYEDDSEGINSLSNDIKKLNNECNNSDFGGKCCDVGYEGVCTDIMTQYLNFLNRLAKTKNIKQTVLQNEKLIKEYEKGNAAILYKKIIPTNIGYVSIEFGTQNDWPSPFIKYLYIKNNKHYRIKFNDNLDIKNMTKILGFKFDPYSNNANEKLQQLFYGEVRLSKVFPYNHIIKNIERASPNMIENMFYGFE